MAGRLGREPGGIRQLVDLIDEHRHAFEYDWRTRFQLPLTVVGDTMEWDETVRLAGILRADPSSMLAASMEGWGFPISREALALYDIFDVTVQVNSDPKKGRPKPHNGRPYKIDTGDHKRYGDTGGRTRAEVVAILNGLGHNLPV